MEQRYWISKVWRSLSVYSYSRAQSQKLDPSLVDYKGIGPWREAVAALRARDITAADPGSLQGQ
ncbi:hypothetical protein E2C01_098763 [Portunus trituberculatus]|uniref:Uncharacterized protein n=1 Tax=Portunus trituberculatus TaxID=210409 RepID=A0A5B7K7S8_PORTR|nr:hypothetical protein [Portunus trituberculatus]